MNFNNKYLGQFNVYNVPKQDETEREFRAKIYFGESRLLWWIGTVILKGKSQLTIEDFLRGPGWDDEMNVFLQRDGNGYQIDPLELFGRRIGFNDGIEAMIEKEYGSNREFSIMIHPVDGSPPLSFNGRVTSAGRTIVTFETGLLGWTVTEKIGMYMSNSSAISKVDFS